VIFSTPTIRCINAVETVLSHWRQVYPLSVRAGNHRRQRPSPRPASLRAGHGGWRCAGSWSSVALPVHADLRKRLRAPRDADLSIPAVE
jgi:hypothetical protein